MHLIDNVPQDVWWDVASQCKYATFFHSPLWHKLGMRGFPHYHDGTIGAELPNGTRIVLPLMQRRRFGPLQDLVSTFELCYGGLIADGPITDTEIEQVYKAACSWKVLRLQVTGNPLAEDIAPKKGFVSEADFSHILHLDSSFDDIFANFSKGHQSSYKKGQRIGISAQVAQTLDEYRAYYTVYQDTLRRWKERGVYNASSIDYPWKLFEHGFYLSQIYPDNIKLWVAKMDDQVISGAWVFYWNKHSVYWHGATMEEYFKYRPSNVIHTEVIRNAVEYGYEFYDFNPSGALEGVIEFKRRFGAQKYPFFRRKYGDAKFGLVRALRRKLK